MLAGFCGYWNIKGCGHTERDFEDKFRAMRTLRRGGFLAFAPQMRHTKRGRIKHEKTAN